MNTTTFTATQIIGEFWISFTDGKNIETGIVVKKLANGKYLIPTGINKKIFLLEDFENLNADTDCIKLPFTVGITDFHANNAMKPATFASFLKAFKEAFCLSDDEKK